MVVVLPAPLGPSMPNTSPRPTVKLTPSTAWTSPYDLRRSDTEMTGSFGLSHVAPCCSRTLFSARRLPASSLACRPQQQIGGNAPPMIAKPSRS